MRALGILALIIAAPLASAADPTPEQVKAHTAEMMQTMFSFGSDVEGRDKYLADLKACETDTTDKGEIYECHKLVIKAAKGE